MEFTAEVKRSWFSVGKSLRAVRNPGETWLQGSVQVTETNVRVSTREGVEEFKPTRLSWLTPTTFRVSGLSRGLRLRANVLRFNSEELAKFVAKTILDIGQVAEEPVPGSAPVEEVETEILATVLIGRLLVFGILVLSIQAVLALGANFLLRFIPSAALAGSVLLLSFLWVAIFTTALNRKVNAGLVTGWFHPRVVKAWLSVDKNYLRVRTWRKAGEYPPFGYTPLEIKWKDPSRFTVHMDRVEFQFSFRTSEDAARIVEKMKTAFPQMRVLWNP